VFFLVWGPDFLYGPNEGVDIGPIPLPCLLIPLIELVSLVLVGLKPNMGLMSSHVLLLEREVGPIQ